MRWGQRVALGVVVALVSACGAPVDTPDAAVADGGGAGCRTSGISWDSSATTVATFTSAGPNPFEPSLAFNNTAAVVRDELGAIYTVYGEVGSKVPTLMTGSGGTWTPSTLKRRYDGKSAQPTIAAVGARLIVAWIETGPTGQVVVAIQSNDRGSNWADPVEVSDPTKTASTVSLYVAEAPDAPAGLRAILGWTEATLEGGAKAMVATYDGSAVPAGAWSAPQVLSMNPAATRAGDVAVGGSGGVLFAVWEDERSGKGSGTKSIYSRRSGSSGASWEPEVQVRTGNLTVGDPSVARIAPSTVYIAYQEKGAGEGSIHLAISSDDGASFTGSLVPTGGDGLFPRVVVNGCQTVAIKFEHFVDASVDPLNASKTCDTTNDNCKRLGLSLSLDGLGSSQSPFAFPGADAVYRRKFPSIHLDDRWVSVTWLDVSDTSSPFEYRLMHQGGVLNR